MRGDLYSQLHLRCPFGRPAGNYDGLLWGCQSRIFRVKNVLSPDNMLAHDRGGQFGLDPVGD